MTNLENVLYDVSQLKKELKMWEEYRIAVHHKSLEKCRTDRTAESFIQTQEKVEKIIGDIQKRINVCIDFISTIEDSVIRQACFYKWVEGKNWVQIGIKLGTTDEAIRVRVNRYLKRKFVKEGKMEKVVDWQQLPEPYKGV